ncbi:hypothetical protein BGZ76_003738 [Entomortierella beljakovae]|nr:hypothetical protein BGZ76_003738 [Entomortierella beljakovae]
MWKIKDPKNLRSIRTFPHTESVTSIAYLSSKEWIAVGDSSVKPTIPTDDQSMDDDEYLVSSDNMSLSRWKLEENKEKNGYQAALMWSSLQEKLEVSGATFNSTRGLTSSAKMLLKQNGATIRVDKPKEVSQN